MLSLIILTSIITGTYSTILPTSRNLTTEILCKSESSFFHTTAQSTRDELHYIISTHGIPSVLVAFTELNTTLHINCSQFQQLNATANSIKFSKKPKYVYGIMFNYLLEYNDTNDKADLKDLDKNNTNWHIIDLGNSELKWNYTQDTQKNIVSLFLNTNSTQLRFHQNGSLILKFHHFGSDGETAMLPHQLYDANSTQIRLVLDHLLPNYVNSRYALEMSLYSIDSKENAINRVQTHRSIDDEHTPGVFELVDWTVKGVNMSEKAYVQWKPVCYTKEPASIKDSTLMKYYELQNTSINTSVINLPYAYFGSQVNSINVNSINVSFGLTNDKFYRLNYYTAWTLSMGYGNAPEEGISILIILIISIGLGIPVLLVVFGGLFAYIRRKRQNDGSFNTSGYAEIN